MQKVVERNKKEKSGDVVESKVLEKKKDILTDYTK